MKAEKLPFIKRSIIIWIVVLDQVIKLFIAHFMMDAQFTIIPHVFSFRTTQNINLGWFWNMLDFMMPLHFAIIISVFAIVVLVIFYRYLRFVTYDSDKQRKLLDLFLMFALAGAFCKLIDDIFWGGSLDYIQMFDWFIFDLKDVYLTVVALPIIIFVLIITEIRTSQLPKEQRKEEQRKQSFRHWAKLGFPIRP